MRVHIGTDHAGFQLKEYLKAQLAAEGFEVVDHGSATYDALDDYPDTCIPAAQSVVAEPGSLGIVIGGSGNGEQLAANKVKGCRAILSWNNDIARLGREHNDANVISFGARFTAPEFALEQALTFLNAEFMGGKHARRVEKMERYALTGELGE